MISLSTARRRALLICAAVSLAAYLAAGFAFTFHRAPSGDEGHFVDTIRMFAAAPSWRLLRTYDEMSGPLPFAAYAAWGRVFGTELFSLRLANLLVGVALQVALLDFLMTVLGAGRRVWLAAVYFIAQPYLVYLSLFVHTDNMAMLGLVAGWRAMLVGRPVGGAVALALALLTRQYCVFAVAGLIAAACEQRSRENVRNAIAGLCACAPLLALFLYWGGPNPVNEVRHRYEGEAFRFHAESLVLYLALIPVYAAPFARLGFRMPDLVAAAAFAALYGLAPVGPSPSSHDATVDTVGAFHWAMRLLGAPPAIEQAVFRAAFSLAGAMLSRTLREWRLHRKARWFHWQTAAFLAVMPWSYLHWEKYLLPALPAIVAAMLLERPGQGTDQA